MGIPGWKLQLMRHQRPSVMRHPTPPDLAGLGSQTAALCDVTRQILHRLDSLIQAMTLSPVTAPSILRPGDPVVMHGFGDLIELFKLSMATVPVSHEVVQVEAAPNKITTVIRNAGERTVPMLLTNNDNAQILRWGAETLTHLNGAVLKSESSAIINILPGTNVYAIFPLFTSTVSISRLGIP